MTQRRSVLHALMRNGQEPLITATGQMLAGKRLADNALLHVNMIAELSPALAPAFPEFAAGDMVIAVRDHNLIFLVDPRDWTMTWHGVGPWLRQLGADFLSDGIIGVCNDRSFAYQPGSDGASELSQPRTADILAPEPRTGEAHLRYGTVPGHEMTSVFRGDTQEEPGDGIPVTEPEAGRGLQLDGAGKGGPGMDQPR